MGTSDRAWVYNAIDFSEGEASPELLAIKFKNPGIAKGFKVKFKECQAVIEDVTANETPKEVTLTDVPCQYTQISCYPLIITSETKR